LQTGKRFPMPLCSFRCVINVHTLLLVPLG